MKSPTILCSVVLIAMLGFAGCSTPASRIGKNEELFRSFPAEVQQKIREGKVEVGFTMEQVRMALGEPDYIATRTDTAGVAQVWSYRDRGPSFGIGLGVGGGGGSTHMGGGVGVSSNRGYPDEKMRIVLRDGHVVAVEAVTK